jgi:hypothetical protein
MRANTDRSAFDLQGEVVLAQLPFDTHKPARKTTAKPAGANYSIDWGQETAMIGELFLRITLDQPS